MVVLHKFRGKPWRPSQGSEAPTRKEPRDVGHRVEARSRQFPVEEVKSSQVFVRGEGEILAGANCEPAHAPKGEAPPLSVCRDNPRRQAESGKRLLLHVGVSLAAVQGSRDADVRACHTR